MPSTSLQQWQNDRIARIRQLDAQCGACLAVSPRNHQLVEENLRGYVVLLSAHFQGFCRDLYTEASQLVVDRVRRRLQSLIQAQFSANLKLDRGNPSVQNIRADFERFGFVLNLSAEPANVPRLADLSTLNTWRNTAAHHGAIPAGAPLNLVHLRDWLNSCDGLALSLDKIMYNQLRRILRRSPWSP